MSVTGFLQSLKTESERFLKLAELYHIHNIGDDDRAEGDGFIIIRISNHLDFKRMANVYLKSMYNTFLVPVWCAAYESSVEPAVGYVLYPKLTPVREMLCEVKGRGDEEAMSHAVRLSLAPIALAIDALHTPIQNRTAFYHRRVCIDEAFVSKVETESGDETTVVYGEAMLMMTKCTRGSHEISMVAHDKSVELGRMKAEYFHHPNPWANAIKLYGKCHDWFSFGVYILEVLGIAMDTKLDQSKEDKSKISYYSKFGVLLKDAAQKRSDRKIFLEYIAIAQKCVEENDKLPTTQEMTHTYLDKTYYLEYKLCEEAAKLLILFDEQRNSSSDYRSLQLIQMAKEKPPCQACLLLPTVPLPLRAYRRGASRRKDPETSIKCDKDCNWFYCARCYRNGERLFCPMQHGTASSVIGHYSSFALILYGEQFEESTTVNPVERDGEQLEESTIENPFERDAIKLSNALKHHMVCGIPEDNVLIRELYSKDRKVLGKEHLEGACKEMNMLIHNKCDNTESDTDYCLFVFYSGHGKGEDDNKPHGSWCTGKGSMDPPYNFIYMEDVRRCIDSISTCNSTNCKESRIEIIYLMDHCYPSSPQDMPKITIREEHDKKLQLASTVNITAMHGSKTFHTSSSYSELTHWFCSLLRSTFVSECSKNRKVGNCGTCTEMIECIETRCHNAFIDGECLEIHKSHMRSKHGVSTKIAVSISVPNPNDPLILAHYQPDGARYRVFPFKGDACDIEIDMYFWLTMDYAAVSNEIISIARMKAQEMQEHVQTAPENTADAQGILGAKAVCLLTENEENESKYNLVWEGDLRNKLEHTSKTYPSPIYYHLIQDRVKVYLCDKSIEGSAEALLNLNASDIKQLVTDFKPEPRSEFLPARQLPNLLVHVVHCLFHQEYKDRKHIRSATSSRASAGKQRQPSGSRNSDLKDKIENSFARFIYRHSPLKGDVTLERLAEEDWHTSAEEADQYFIGTRKRPFRVHWDGSEVRIKWKVE